MITDQRDVALGEELDKLDVPELGPEFYEDLRIRIAKQPVGVSAQRIRPVAPVRYRQSRGRWITRLAAASALLVLAAGGLWEVVQNGGGQPSAALIGERAYAAVTEPTGILHYVVASWSPPDYTFSEYWVALHGSPRYRAVQTTTNGRLFGQIHYGEQGMRGVRYDPNGNPIDQPQPTGDVVEGQAPGRVPTPRDAATAPLDAYRQLVRSGNVRSVTEVDVEGQPAYRLVVDVDGGRPGDETTTTYVVNRDTYLPIEYTIRTVTPVPGLTLTTHERFLIFETLDRSDANETLLSWDSAPSPFQLGRSLPPPSGIPAP